MFVFGLYSYKNVTVQSSTTEFNRVRSTFTEQGKTGAILLQSKMDSWVMGTSSLVLKIHLFIKTHLMTTMVKAVFCALIVRTTE